MRLAPTITPGRLARFNIMSIKKTQNQMQLTGHAVVDEMDAMFAAHQGDPFTYTPDAWTKSLGNYTAAGILAEICYRHRSIWRGDKLDKAFAKEQYYVRRGELADKFRVSRSTVDNILAKLRSMGLIDTRLARRGLVQSTLYVTPVIAEIAKLYDGPESDRVAKRAVPEFGRPPTKIYDSLSQNLGDPLPKFTTASPRICDTSPKICGVQIIPRDAGQRSHPKKTAECQVAKRDAGAAPSECVSQALAEESEYERNERERREDNEEHEKRLKAKRLQSVAKPTDPEEEAGLTQVKDTYKRLHAERFAGRHSTLSTIQAKDILRACLAYKVAVVNKNSGEHLLSLKTVGYSSFIQMAFFIQAKGAQSFNPERFSVRSLVDAVYQGLDAVAGRYGYLNPEVIDRWTNYGLSDASPTANKPEGEEAGQILPEGATAPTPAKPEAQSATSGPGQETASPSAVDGPQAAPEGPGGVQIPPECADAPAATPDAQGATHYGPPEGRLRQHSAILGPRLPGKRPKPAPAAQPSAESMLGPRRPSKWD